MVLLPLISFQRNKIISDLLVRSTLKSDESPGTFNCKRCKTCPFIHDQIENIGGNILIKCSLFIAFDSLYCTKTSKPGIQSTGAKTSIMGIVSKETGAASVGN